MIKKVFKSILNFYKRHEYLRVFTIVWIASFLIFLPEAIHNGLALPINGDYSLQQLHFYVEGRDAFWTFITTGEFKMWSYQGFLGSNYFAANTFYYLTSPFSLPIYFLPEILVPQGIFIMMTIKMATGGLFMYILFKKFYHTKDTTALIGGLAYALCGWGMFYVWFNHFHDVLAVLPLTLIGVEYCLQKKKGYLLALALFICGLVNYFFLFTFVFSTFAYALFRYFQLFKKNRGYNLTIIIQGVLFSIVGVGMCAFIIYPALNVVSTLSRIGTSNNLINFLKFFFENPIKDSAGYHLGRLKSISAFFEGENLHNLLKYIFVFNRNADRNFFYPLVEFVFPEVGCWENIVFSSKYYDNTYSSLYISMPLIFLTWTRLIEALKSKRVSYILASIFIAVAPFIPFFYILFGGFSSVLYGRWLIVILIFILCSTIPIIDRLSEIPKIHFDYALFITISIQFVCIATAAHQNALTMDIYHTIGLVIVILYTFVVYYLLRHHLSEKTVYMGHKLGDVAGSKLLLLFVAIDLIVIGSLSLKIQGVQDYWSMYGGQNLLEEQRHLIDDLQEEDPSFYRLFDSAASRNANNLALTLGYKGLGSFHSVNNSELETFIQDWSRASYSYGNWSMGIDEKRYNLDTFLNVKYYLLPTTDTNIPWGFSEYKRSEHFVIYKNDYHVELGYAFNKAIAMNDFITNEHFMKEAALNELVVIEDEDLDMLIETLGDDLTVIDRYYSDFTYSFVPNDTISINFRGSENWIPLSTIYDMRYYIPSDRDAGALYGEWKENNLRGDTIRVDLPDNRALCKDASSENPYHLIVKLCYGPNVKISLYHDDELVTQDAHGPNNYDHSSDHKYARGFYVDKSINRIEFELLNDTTVQILTRFGLSFYSEAFDKYKERQEALALNAFSNIKHTNNTIDFETNYTDKKIIVLSVPYDIGWSLTINGKKADIIKVDSGFIGIIADSGNQVYHLEYQTPNLVKGVKISAISTGGFIVLTFGFFLLSKKKPKRKEEETKDN